VIGRLHEVADIVHQAAGDLPRLALALFSQRWRDAAGARA
jgi:hypothetical protein